jgi:hypothetical protein
MSKIALSGNASGTGTLTIAAPNTNTDRTLTLPDNTGTILTNATTAGFPAGSVLQVVQAISTTDTAITSTSFQDTTLTASITPSSATSKILVFVTQAYLVYRETSAGISCGMKILRGATGIVEHDITPQISAAVSLNGEIATRGVWSFCYLDSPNTTSSTTYKTQSKVATSNNNAQIRLQQNGTEESSITLMEIAA